MRKKLKIILKTIFQLDMNKVKIVISLILFITHFCHAMSITCSLTFVLIQFCIIIKNCQMTESNLDVIVFEFRFDISYVFQIRKYVNYSNKYNYLNKKALRAYRKSTIGTTTLFDEKFQRNS